MQYFQSFKIFEAYEPPKKIRFESFPKDAVTKLGNDSPEALEYLNAIIKELDAMQDANKLSLQLQLKGETGLTKAQMEEKEKEFKDIEKYKDGMPMDMGKYYVLYYKTQTFEEILKSDGDLKKKVDTMSNEIKGWNDKYESIFKFDNNVSDKVTNVDDTNKALGELKNILDKHKDVICCIKAEFEGHTSTAGEPDYNVKLSQGRAETIKNMFFEVMPEAKAWHIVSTGKGEAEPLVTPDDTEEKAAKNRRVEFKLDVTGKEEAAPQTETKYNILCYVVILGKQIDYDKTYKVKIDHKLKKIGSWKSRIKCPVLN